MIRWFAVGCALWALQCCQLLLPAAAVLSRLPLYLENPQLDPSQARAARNIAYYSVIALGTPPRNFTTCIDTGSADLWIPSTRCTTSACSSHNQFDPQASSTVQVSNGRFGIQYGTGEVAGYVISDTLQLGDPIITVAGQGFGEAILVSDDFSATTCDGLFGLAFPALTSLNTNPPFFNMVSDNLLDAPEFSIWLNPNDTNTPSGELILGGRDSSRYTGDLTQVPITEPGYWRVALTGISVGGSGVGLSTDSAILDSGTTGIITTTADAQAINGAVPQLQYYDELGVWLVSCSQVPSLPDLTFALNGAPFSVPASIWVQPLTDALDRSTDACVSSVIPAVAPGGPMVLGSPFLRAWYSIFTYGSSSSSVSLGRSIAVASA